MDEASVLLLLESVDGVGDDAAKEVIGEAPSAEMLLKSIGFAPPLVRIGPLAGDSQPLFGGYAG